MDRAGWLAATGITEGRGGEDHRSRVYPSTPTSLAKPEDPTQRSGSSKQKHHAELEESPGRTRQPCGKNEQSWWSERRKNKLQFHVDLKEDVSDEIPRHGKHDTERESQGRCSPHTGCRSVRVDQEAVGRSLWQNRHSQKLMN